MAKVEETFCPPPERFKLFTNERFKRAQSSLPEDLADDQLIFFRPPPPLLDGEYTSFGEIFQVHEETPSLESMGIPQLYAKADGEKEVDLIGELKRLQRAIGFNFLQIVQDMSVDPEQHERKLEEIRLLFINAHHLINSFRREQAQETLLLMLQERARKKREEALAVHARCDQIEVGLREAQAALIAASQQPPTQPDIPGSPEDVQMGNPASTEENPSESPSTEHAQSIAHQTRALQLSLDLVNSML